MFEETKVNEKEAADGTFFNKKIGCIDHKTASTKVAYVNVKLTKHQFLNVLIIGAIQRTNTVFLLKKRGIEQGNK